MQPEDWATDGLASCGLPALWADRFAWTVLDTHFRNGADFLNCWLAWRRDPHRPRMLHYVGIASTPSKDSETPANGVTKPGETQELRQLSVELHAHCDELEPGFHRIFLEQGKVSLTLCLGDIGPMLREHIFHADTLLGEAPNDKWMAQLLARRCKRGTRFHLSTPRLSSTPAPQLTGILRAAGFSPAETAATHGILHGRFDPAWDIRTNRTSARLVAPEPGRCAIVGAGVSGACLAYAMAIRGWQVTVLDQEATPAGGASGLPAGLAVPHVSADDSPRSRLTRHGIQLLSNYASRLLARGRDWERSGVLERRPNAVPLWHPKAAWVKPYRLVQAWLAQTGITFTGNTKIASLRRLGNVWHLCDVHGVETGPFDEVILANALGSAKLLGNSRAQVEAQYLPREDLTDKLSALQAIHGTLSHGTYAEAIPHLPTTPVNGNGCFIPHVPDGTAEKWCAGSTFETDPLVAADLWGQHCTNMQRLEQLIPDAGAEIAETLDRGPVTQWSATRCVTHDRLPLVGPVGAGLDGGLWLCVGMGSRGLSFSALCAEILVARLCAEPLPVESALARSLDANRTRRKRPANNGLQTAS